eukprot:TRINITY_DN1326_c1_g2_i4.p3 TRINITY_DN1326_c1_g2~~TRINITY_DN1326_c1_g2_i4.p3  ORF type:complete len:173 (-),score=11.11 TRINITY_DN1326_c1_g2_i4:100-618(-)
MHSVRRKNSQQTLSSTSRKGTTLVLSVVVLLSFLFIGRVRHALDILKQHNTKELYLHGDYTSTSHNEINSNNQQKENEPKKNYPHKYHVVVSVSASPYQQWQMMIFYYHYSKVKQQNPDSAMGGFTRLLHSGEDDEYSRYINTVIVDPLPQGVDKGVKPQQRPWAFGQLRHD